MPRTRIGALPRTQGATVRSHGNGGPARRVRPSRPRLDPRPAAAVLRFLSGAAMGVALLAVAPARAADDVAVTVTKTDTCYSVQAVFSVAASVDLTWDVLTDFDQMAKILSNVDDSKIVDRKGNTFNVVQKSHSTSGPVRLSLQSTRLVELTPKTLIRSQFVSGDSLKSSLFTTRIAPAGEGAKVTVQGTFVPTWLAGGVITTEAVETQTRRQYTELRDEILRRKLGQPPPACLQTKTCS